MKKILLFNSMLFVFNTIFGQISFEDKINLYDYNYLSVNIIYDDFDNDNDLDIIKHGAPNSRNVLLQKNENGNFNANPSILLDTRKNPIISLDLNNDGFPDLITYQEFSTIGVLYNLQNDTFSEEETVQSFHGSYSHTLKPIKIDYNSDGFMDLILINNTRDAYLLRNNQLGGLEPAKFLIPVGTFNYINKIEDFDNDGDLDFYIWDYNKLKIHLFDEDSDDFIQPTALQATSSLESFGVIDLDGNGYKDILYLKNGSVWAKYFDFDKNTDQYIVLNDIIVVDNIPLNTNYNNHNSIYIENKENGVYAIYVALLTTDNHHNIYKFNVQNNVFSTAETVLANFEINTLSLNQFKFLDLNNDYNLDFTYTTSSNQNKMILINNNINDPLDKTICVQQFILPNDFSVIDMNGDGIEDICVGKSGLAYFEKTANNELSEMQNLIGVAASPNTTSYPNYNIIDFNNDGIGDVIDFESLTDNIKLFKNLGNDSFEFIQSINLPNNLLVTDVSFADIDSDGFKDLIIYNIFEILAYNSLDSTENSGFYWAKNNSGVDFGTIQPIVITGVDNISTSTFAFDDFNDDGEVDLLMLNSYFENKEMYFLENSNGQFSGNRIATITGNYSRSHLKIKDFDQDGDLDFFLYDINRGQNSGSPLLFFKNDSQNNFQSIIIENLNIEDLEFSDGDGDGINEIYAWNYDHNSYMNNIFYYTTPDYVSFTKVQIDSYSSINEKSDPSTRGDLLLYDYNDDGKDDLFINNYSSFYGLISVYKNNSETLGIEEIKNDNTSNKLQVYPNPFVNSVNWSSQKNEIYNIKLFSQNGKLIFEKTTSENNLNLSSFNSGIYFFVIKESTYGNKWVYKIIKK
ncbi:T9SS type A sorting domain-containing protein [Hyunsoonleella sp. SJ7]|uniref:T9SS type A sorting domain-containing protein n=1 Tax=Hyunsoonleella aquatilis TaxID=2762758 RepID=A0A923H7F9_9FLAO|nr:T9SS type A sorting domain-containing protein [Hyunsoonleella aquatilis]MBC3757285.1 T9SS type A sorting domain-containing protein [Hyunsoonleella aquatilis]